MTTNNLYDALEICLQALEQGSDVESCLVRFPALAGELRPMLETATQARSAAVTEVPQAAMRRSKARVLQAAAEIREQATAPRKSWQFGRTFRLSLASLAMIVFLLTGGTGLVNASSGTLPGDSLYQVKRGWEGVRLVFVADPKVKAELEDEFEQERVQEINELYHEGRIEQVNFQGVVEVQKNEYWEISGLRVAVEDETRLEGTIIPGSLVQVLGATDDGVIKAESIRLLATPVATFTPIPSLTAQPTSTLPPTSRPTDEPATLEPTETLEPAESPEPSETSEPTESPEPTEKPDPTESPEPTEKPDPTKTPKPDDNDNDNNNSNDNDNDNSNDDSNDNN